MSKLKLPHQLPISLLLFTCAVSFSLLWSLQRRTWRNLCWEEKVAAAPALDGRFRMSGLGAAPMPSLMARRTKEQLLLWIWLDSFAAFDSRARFVFLLSLVMEMCSGLLSLHWTLWSLFLYLCWSCVFLSMMSFESYLDCFDGFLVCGIFILCLAFSDMDLWLWRNDLGIGVV